MRHVTAELLELRIDDGGAVRLAFACGVGEAFELAMEGDPGAIEVEGGSADSGVRIDEALVLVIEALAPEVVVRIA